MDQQRRCLTGMANGAPIVVPVDPVAAAVLHTFDAGSANDANGRPFLDVVSLFLQNRGANPANITVIVAGTTLRVRVAAGTVVQALVETPFGGVLSAPTGGLTITVGVTGGEGLSTTASAWGWFVRTQG